MAQQTGLTVAVINGANAPGPSNGHQVGRQPNQPSEINEENPGSPATHGTSGQVTVAQGVAVVAAAPKAAKKGLPTTLRTNSLASARRR